ncbi:hypothetical protein IW262DRAFT_1498592 [Armillaria fumosa]|nr:hypothetical protein IW262DRAFT_1498592 [Armillaria fumosa]
MAVVVVRRWLTCPPPFTANDFLLVFNNERRGREHNCKHQAQGYVYQLDFFDAYHDDHCYHQLLHHLNNVHVKLDIFNDIRATLERPQCSPLPQCLLFRPQRRRLLSRPLLLKLTPPLRPCRLFT